MAVHHSNFHKIIIKYVKSFVYTGPYGFQKKGLNDTYTRTSVFMSYRGFKDKVKDHDCRQLVKKLKMLRFALESGAKLRVCRRGFRNNSLVWTV